MHKPYMVLAAVFGGLAVALGAFGAHGLEKITGDPAILESFRTGVQYQMYHALALLATGIMAPHFTNRWIRWAGTCFITGIILFSGSLYLLTFIKIQESGGAQVAGPMTPLGGMFFIAGWLFLLVAVLKK